MCPARLLAHLNSAFGVGGDVALLMNAWAWLSARKRLSHPILHHTASDLTVCQGLLHLLGNWELLNGKQYVVIQTGRLLRLYFHLVTLVVSGAAVTKLMLLNAFMIKKRSKHRGLRWRGNFTLYDSICCGKKKNKSNFLSNSHHCTDLYFIILSCLIRRNATMYFCSCQ